MIDEGMGRSEGRLEYLDAIKGYAILLVVFCHYVLLPDNSYVGNALMALAWSAVPCFIMVSGGLMHKNACFDRRKYVRRITKLYASLCIWKLVYLAAFSKVREVSFSVQELVNFIFFGGQIANVTDNMWYLAAYLVVLLMLPVTHFLYHGKDAGKRILFFLMMLAFIDGIGIYAVNFLLGLLGVTQFTVSGLHKLMPLTNYSHILFYFILGAFLFAYGAELKQRLLSVRYGRLLPAGLTAAGLAGLMLVKYAENNTLQWASIYIANGYCRLSTLFLSVGVYLSVLMYQCRLNHAVAKYLGKYTLGVYCIHFLLLIICNACLYPCLRGYHSVLLNCAKTLVITAVSVILTRLLLKIPVLKNLVG